MPIQYSLIAEGDDILAEEPASAREHASIARQIIAKIERKNHKQTLTQKKLYHIHTYIPFSLSLSLIWCMYVYLCEYGGLYVFFIVHDMIVEDKCCWNIYIYTVDSSTYFSFLCG